MVDTTKSSKVNFAINNDDSESEEGEGDELIKDISSNFPRLAHQQKKIWLAK